MLSRPIGHLAGVAQLAAREQHELGSTFRFKQGAPTFLAFRTAARGMAAAAQAHRQVLLKYGLSEPVLEEFGRMLDEFDAAVTLGNDGRTIRTGATSELSAVASEIAQIVRVMDARNRQRFKGTGSCWGRGSARARCWGRRGGCRGVGRRRGPVPTPAEGEVSGGRSLRGMEA
jgi:hypothetical protein